MPDSLQSFTLARICKISKDPAESMLFLQKGLSLKAKDMDHIILICMYLTNRIARKEAGGSHDPFIYQLLEIADTIANQNLMKNPQTLDFPSWSYRMGKLVVSSLKAVTLLKDGYLQDALELAKIGLSSFQKESQRHINLGYPLALMHYIKVSCRLSFDKFCRFV